MTESVAHSATPLRAGAEVREEDGFRIFLPSPNAAQLAEEAFFRGSEIENAAADLYRSLLVPGTGKSLSLLVFDEIVRRYALDLRGDLLELGGGYGFLSAYVKRRFPGVRCVYSDVSAEAVRKSVQYERLFGAGIDEKWVLAAEETPFADASFDRIVFFSSFHHVQDPQRAAHECARLLRPGGRAHLLFEPASPAWLRPLYTRHVHRDEIDERFYSVGEYRAFFERAGLSFRNFNFAEPRFRWSVATTAYYLALRILPEALRGLFPCSQVMVAEKPGGGGG